MARSLSDFLETLAGDAIWCASAPKSIRAKNWPQSSAGPPKTGPRPCFSTVARQQSSPGWPICWPRRPAHAGRWGLATSTSWPCVPIAPAAKYGPRLARSLAFGSRHFGRTAAGKNRPQRLGAADRATSARHRFGGAGPGPLMAQRNWPFDQRGADRRDRSGGRWPADPDAAGAHQSCTTRRRPARSRKRPRRRSAVGHCRQRGGRLDPAALAGPHVPLASGCRWRRF